MNLNYSMTNDYDGNSDLLTMKKQTQNKPKQTQFILSLPVVSLSNQSKIWLLTLKISLNWRWYGRLVRISIRP
ncbi:MAG: hypothetical protein WC476_06100 [Phycisphaerae bacterium]